MNPPFRDAEAHVRHGLQLLPDWGTLAVLLRMTWIAAKARADLLKHCRGAIIAGRHVGSDIHLCMLTTLPIMRLNALWGSESTGNSRVAPDPGRVPTENHRPYVVRVPRPDEEVE